MEELALEASAFTPEEQEYIAVAARRAMADLRDERKWDEKFGQSQTMLGEMASRALAERRAGQTKKLR